MRNVLIACGLALVTACSSKTSSGGGTANAAEAFVGSWVRAGTVTTTCGTSAPVELSLTGDLILVLVPSNGTLVGTRPDGCMTSYTVAGAVATAAAGQICMVTVDGGAPETDTSLTHTLTLSADGQSLAEATTGTELRMVGGAEVMCTYASNGAFTKGQ